MRKQIEQAATDLYHSSVQELSISQKLANKLLFLGLAYAIVLLLGGFVFAIAEGKTYGDSLWWAIVTASSVGYGDMYPTTIVGRIDATILMNLVLLVLVPVLTGRVSAQMIVDSDKFTNAEQEEIKNNLKLILARLDAMEKNQ